MAKIQIKSEKLAFFEFFRLWSICNAFLAQIIDFSLGLSVKWADRNIDAANSYMFGNLLPWGDPIGINLGEKNYLKPDTPTDISGTKLDIARREWKGKWRLPTLDEMKELFAHRK